MIYDSLEQNIVILAACIPALRPLFRSKKPAKKSAPQLEDQRPLHRHLNKSTPCSLLARTVHESAGTHQNEIGPRSLDQKDEVGLESLDGRDGNVEIAPTKTVDISHERPLDHVPGMWSAVSHPQDDETNFDQARLFRGA